MKKITKISLRIIAALIVLVLCGATFINFNGVPTYEVKMPENLKTLKVPVTPEKVARGEKIAQLLCIKCHANEQNQLVGKQMKDFPAVFGTAYSYNITQDKQEGIGNWTDAELAYFIRTGVRKNGSYAAFMPNFPLMAESDVESIIAFLHSNHPTVKAAKGEPPMNKPNLFVKFLCNVVLKPTSYPTTRIEIPDSTNKVVFGEYIANRMVACYQCHSKDLTKNDPLFPEKSLGFYGGGNPMLNMEGQTIPTANITMDEETGIGKYSEEQFVKAAKFCQKPDGTLLRYPMEPQITLTDYEVKAIFAYLKTVPKIKNKVN